MFAANQRRGLRSGFDQGDVSPHAALFIGAGLYQRLYERRSARTRRRYAVSLLVDASASMLKWAGENIKPLMFAALVIGGIVYLGIIFNVGWEIWAVFIGICIATVGAIGFAMANKQ